MKNSKRFGKYSYHLLGFIIVIASSCELQRPASPPELSTIPVDSITSISAKSGGNITWDGGSVITARGICWNTKVGPTILDNITTEGEGEGSFKSILTGLISGTNYYVRAYATNSAGTSYGNEYIFITPLTDIEGNVYGTVVIGAQVWMTENLKTSRYNDNSLIPNVTDNSVWLSLSSPAFCLYQNVDPEISRKYGALYNWFAVNTGKLCPDGWHIPSEDEWESLTGYLGGEDYAGGRLKEQGLIHWKSPNTGASNDYGFSALPGGYRTGAGSGSFRASGYIGWWWTGKEYDMNWARNRTIAFDTEEIAKGRGLKTNGYSVRCIKD